jgi:8-oxo-dGTP diphosphatase
MRDRPAAPSRPASGRRTSFTVDVVVFSPREHVLGVLCEASSSRRDKRVLPFGVPRPSEPLERCARRLVRDLTGAEPAWIEQVGAFADGKRHVSDAELSIGFVAVMPSPPGDGDAGQWATPGDLVGLSPRQRSIADAALNALRTRMDHAPIAFRLLPSQFTLTELQQTYELLLGKRLHKASFRRALQAAFLVQPTDEWRSEGRGRPAQFFEFSPRKRRSGRRGVRFDLMS